MGYRTDVAGQAVVKARHSASWTWAQRGLLCWSRHPDPDVQSALLQRVAQHVVGAIGEDELGPPEHGEDFAVDCSPGEVEEALAPATVDVGTPEVGAPSTGGRTSTATSRRGDFSSPATNFSGVPASAVRRRARSRSVPRHRQARSSSPASRSPRWSR